MDLYIKYNANQNPEDFFWKPDELILKLYENSKNKE